jgi:hypothetical protein
MNQSSSFFPMALLLMLMAFMTFAAEAEPRYQVGAILGGFSKHYVENGGEGFNEVHNSVGVQARRISTPEAPAAWVTNATIIRTTNSYNEPSWVFRGSISGCSMGDHEFCFGPAIGAATGYKKALGSDVQTIPGFLASYTYKGFGIEVNVVPATFTAVQGIVRF